MTHTPPDVPVSAAKRGFWRGGASLVWLVPALALAVAVFVAWQSINDRGPVIKIMFDNASGVHAGETELRYRDVAVGTVEKVAFTPDLSKVSVSVRVDKDVAPFIDNSASFWVVRPEVTTRGVTGLDTVLSGVFIEGTWDAEAKGLKYQFDGLPQAPLVKGNQKGLRFTLRSTRDEGLTENTPILFKGIEVGRIGPAKITQDGSAVYSEAIIYSPHDRLVTSATRFWDTSGFTFSLGPNGAEIDFTSIASLVSGGIAFDTLVSGGDPVADGQTFQVFPDEGSARNSVFEGSEGRKVNVSVLFEENVAGLAADSPVELRGIKVGRVLSVTGLVNPERFGDNRARLVAVLELDVTRLGLSAQTTKEDAIDYLASRVQDGLRAQLTNASILTGGLKIVLTQVDDAAPAELDRNADPYPFIPTTASDVQDVQATAEGVFERINKLPIEDLLSSAIKLMNNASDLVASPDLQATPSDIRAILANVQNVVGNDALQQLPGEVSDLLAELQGAAEDLRSTVAKLNDQNGVDRALAAIDAAAKAAETISTAAEGVPGLLDEVQGVAADARPVVGQVQQALAELQGLTAQARALIGSDAAQGLPAEVSDLLARLQDTAGQLTDTIAAVNDQDGVARLLAAIDAAGAAAGDVSSSVEGVPELVTQLQGVAANARELPLDQVVTRVNALLDSADTLVGSEGTQALPAELNATLSDLRMVMASAQGFIGSEGVKALPGDASALMAELQGTAADLRATLAQVTEQRGIERLLAAVDSAAAAADDVSSAVEGVPALVADIQSVAAEARDLPLDELTRRVSDLVSSADALVSSEDTARLPERLNEALSQLSAILADLREGGAVENVNATLASARRAADSITASSDRLPSVIDRINGLLGQATTTIGGYDQSSELNRQLRSALRDVQQAADAVASLARALERRPNSIILGR